MHELRGDASEPHALYVVIVSGGCKRLRKTGAGCGISSGDIVPVGNQVGRVIMLEDKARPRGEDGVAWHKAHVQLVGGQSDLIGSNCGHNGRL